MIIYYVFAFVFGAVVGSFLNVVILRYNTGESIVYISSHCFSCRKKLSWYELVPIFSFLIQKGKCRKCKSKISWQYPIVEMLAGVIFTLVAQKIFDFPAVLYYWLTFSLLIVISAYDFRHKIIPNLLVYILIFLAFCHWLAIDKAALDVLLTGLGFFILFFGIWFFSKGRWMGLGDAKLALFIGLFLGLEKGLAAFFLSFWIGALLSIFLLLFLPKKFTLKSRIPFGPFLVLGAALAFLLGENILRLYFSVFI